MQGTGTFSAISEGPVQLGTGTGSHSHRAAGGIRSPIPAFPPVHPRDRIALCFSTLSWVPCSPALPTGGQPGREGLQAVSEPQTSHNPPGTRDFHT